MGLLSHKDKTPFIIFTSVCLVVFLSLWLNNKKQPTTDTVAIDKNLSPDSFMENFRLISTDATGKINQRLSGKNMQHYASGITVLESPLILFTQNHNDWQLQADHGEIFADKSISLNGNVTIKQFNDNVKHMTIKTSELYYSIKDGIASSDKAVNISNAHGEFAAIGLRANLSDRSLQLLSNVKGRYALQ